MVSNEMFWGPDHTGDELFLWEMVQGYGRLYLDAPSLSQSSRTFHCYTRKESM